MHQMYHGQVGSRGLASLCLGDRQSKAQRNQIKGPMCHQSATSNLAMIQRTENSENIDFAVLQSLTGMI